VFTVTTYDRVGTRRPEGGESSVAVTVAGTGTHTEVPCAVVDNNDGTFACTFTPPRGFVAGGDAALTIAVAVENHGSGEGGGDGAGPITGSPFAVPVIGEYDGADLELGGSCLRPEATAGEELELTLRLKPGFDAPPLSLALGRADDDDNGGLNVDGGGANIENDNDAVEPAAPEARSMPPEIDPRSGTVTGRCVAITVFRAGLYTVDIPDLPAAIARPGGHSLRIHPSAAAAARSALSLPAGPHPVDAPLRGTLRLFDTYGNRCSAERDTAAVASAHVAVEPEAGVTIEGPAADGTYV
jgi:hypothetical protein